MDYEESNKLVCEIDLEKLLLSKGVQKEHISYIKSEKLNRMDYFDEYYELIDSKQSVKLVPTTKITGIHRASGEYSIYDNAAGKCKSELNVYRMATAISKIQQNSLSDLYKWYEKECDPVRLAYYKDDDTYRVSGDGNHRCLYALTINAPVIKAKVVTKRINNHRMKNYYLLENILERYSIVEINDDYNEFFNSDIDTTFSYNGKYYDVYGYQQLKDGDPVRRELDLQILESQLEEDFKILNKWYFKGNSSLTRMKILLMKLQNKIYDNPSIDRVLQHINERLIINNSF